MAKPKRFKITAIVTIEEVGPEPDETRPIIDAIEARPATWYPAECDRQRRRRRPKGERPNDERAR